MKTTFKCFCIFLSFFYLAGCSSINLARISENIRMVFGKEVEFFLPPSRKELTTFEYVVVDSNTLRAEATFDMIAQRFETSRIGSSPYFSGVFYEVGRVPKSSLASTATFSLFVAEPVVNLERTVENRFQCPGNQAIRSCDSNEAIHYTVNCQTNTVRVSASYTIKKAKNGKQIYSDHTTVTENSKACSDTGGAPTPANELTYKAKEKLGEQISNLFVPSILKRPNDLVDEDDSLPANSQAMLEGAFKNASEGRIEQAMIIYQELLLNHSENPSLWFNLGYCHQALGDFKEASSDYKKALSFNLEDFSKLEKYSAETEEWLAKGELKIARK